MNNPLYLEETKAYLSTKETYKSLAVKFKVSNTGMSHRVQRTIGRLVEYFDFDRLEIFYPALPKYKGKYGRFRECRKYASFWLELIEDYENGKGAIDYAKPKQLSELELDYKARELLTYFKESLRDNQMNWYKKKKIEIAINSLLLADAVYKEISND